MKIHLLALALAPALLAGAGPAQAATPWLAQNSLLNQLGAVARDPSSTRPSAQPLLRRVEGVRAVPGLNNSCDPQGLCLSVTVGRDTSPDACAATSTTTAALGDRINFCYTVTNQSPTTSYSFHTAADDSTDPEQQFFVSRQATLAPGATYRYNRISAPEASVYATTTWSAAAELPAYSYDDQLPSGFIDISGSGRRLDLQPGGVAQVALPFPLTLYATPSRHIAIDSRGAIAFAQDDSGLYGLDLYSLLIPWAEGGTDGYTAEISPYRMAMGFGSVFTATLGSAPNRQFVVQWHQMRPMNSLAFGSDYAIVDTPEAVTFEVVFSENSAELLFHYLHTSFGDPTYDDGAVAAIGLNYGVSADLNGVGAIYSLSTPSLHDGLSVRWSPTAVASSQTTAFASVQLDTPHLAFDPRSVSAAVAPDATATAAITLMNQGAGRMDFRFAKDDPPVAAAVPAFALSHVLDGLTFLGVSKQVAWFDAASPAPPPTAFAAGLPLSISNNDGYALGAVAFVGDDFDTLYWITSDLTRVDVVSGTQTVVGPTGLIAQSARAEAAAYDASTDTLYVLASRSTLMAPDLYAIDRRSGAAHYVGPLIIDAPSLGVVAIAFSPSGELYGVRTLGAPDGSGLSRLYKFDRDTLQGQEVGPLGLDYFPYASGVGLAFDRRDGTLYMSNAYDGTGSNQDSNQFVFKIDPQTGHAERIGMFNSLIEGTLATQLAGLALATPTPQPCVNAADVPWLSIDVTEGSVETGSAQITFAFDAHGLAVGVYNAALCLGSNDPANRHLVVPVTLSVGDVDHIFANGFDGAP